MPLKGTQGQGSVDIDGVLSNRIAVDMSEIVKRVDPDIAPFTIMTSLFGFESTDQELFEFMEADDFDATLELSADAAVDATTLVTITGDFVKATKNMMLRNLRTDETFFVEATPTTTSITVTPAWPVGTGGSASLAGDKLLIVSTAMEYGSNPVDPITLDPAREFNYVQHSRRSWEVDGRIAASRLLGPGALEFAEDSNIREFLKQQERKFLLGERGRVLTGVNSVGTVTTSGGIRFYMDKSGSNTFQKNFAGLPMTKSEFNVSMRGAFKYGSSRKLMICGWNIMEIIDEWANNQLEVVQGAKELGVTIKRYHTTHGTLDIMPHKAWNNEWGMTGEAWILDPANIKRRGIAGRSDISLTTRVPNGGGNHLSGEGQDAIKQEIAVEDGLEIRNMETFARFYNIAQ